MQGGRYKAMFKLKKLLPQATKLAKKDSNLYQVGIGGWVAARFTAEKPLPKAIWTKWLDESYELSRSMSSKTVAQKKAAKNKISKKKALEKANRNGHLMTSPDTSEATPEGVGKVGKTQNQPSTSRYLPYD